jgi:transporter family protein
MPRWLVLSLAAVVFWGLWAVISKLIGDAISASHSQALSTIGLLPVMLALGFSKRLAASGNRRRGIGVAFAAGLLACAGNVAYYHAFQMGGRASTVVPLTALYPLVTVVLAVVFLREKLSSIQLLGIATSLVAIWLFNISGMQGWLTGWLLYAFLPILLWGVTGLLQKVSTNHVSGELSTLWFLAAFVPVAVLILLLQPLAAGGLSARVWLLSAALGLFFSLGNFALLLAFASAGKASIITPLTGLYPLVSVPVAIMFLGETVGTREWIGIGLAVLSVIALSMEPSKPGVAAEGIVA